MNRQLIIILATLGVCGALLLVAGMGAAVALLYLKPEGSPTDTSQDAHRRVTLPASVLAKPAQAESSVNTISIKVASGDRVTIGDHEGSIIELALLLDKALQDLGDVSAVDCRVVVSAEPDLSTSTVQQVIRICKNAGFENFRLRVAHE